MNERCLPTHLTQLEGDREALERELMWNIALDGDRVRREQLSRTLTPAANSQLALAAGTEQTPEPSSD